MNDWYEAEKRVERAQRLSESHQWAEALAEIDAALAINPENAMWHAHRGALLDELERQDEAVEAFSSAHELEPEDQDVMLALGVVLLRVDRLAKAIELFEELARFDPNFEPAYCHRIHAYAELGEHDKAEEMFYTAQELDESCPHCFYHIGVSLASRKQFERAIYCWRRVLEIEPEYLGVHRRIAQAYRKQGKLDKAHEYFLREIRNDPGNTDLLFEMADLTVASGDVTKTIARLTQIIELDPEHSEARFVLGKIYLAGSRAEQAMEQFETIESCGSGDDELPGFHRWVGEALFRLDRYHDAAERLRLGIESEDVGEDHLMLLATCLLADQKYGDAADAYRRVLAVNADHAAAHHQLGVCLVQEGQTESGLNHFLQAIRNKPDYVVAMHNAAVASAHLGRWRDAREWVGRTLRADPHNQDARRLKQRFWRFWVRFQLRRVARGFVRFWRVVST